MKIFKTKIDIKVIIFNIFTILVALATVIVGVFTDNQKLLEDILTPEAFAGLAAFMASVSGVLHKVSKPKDLKAEPEPKPDPTADMDPQPKE